MRSSEADWQAMPHVSPGSWIFTTFAICGTKTMNDFQRPHKEHQNIILTKENKNQ